MDLRDAFLKLRPRDKVVLGIAGAGVIAFAIGVLFLLLNGALINNLDFPKTGANNHGSIQNHNSYSYDDLPYFISFPETSKGISVGGEEIGVLSDGTAFKFSDEAYIVAATPESGETSEAFIKNRFFSLLSGTEVSEGSGYIHKISDGGYLNAEYLEYEGGIIKAPDGSNYYVLSYRQPSAGGVDPMIAVVTTDKTKLQNGMTLLNRMWGTLEQIEPAADDETELAEASEEDGMKEQTSVTEEISLPTDTAETIANIAKLQKERADMLHQTSGTEPKELIESFVVPSALSDVEVVFYCDYRNVVNTPEYAYLINPKGEKLMGPDLFNEDNDGIILFNVNGPEPGTWKMVVSNDTPLGEYSMSCEELEVYNAWRYPAEGTYSRDSD